MLVVVVGAGMQSTQGSGLGTQATPCRGPLTALGARCTFLTLPSRAGNKDRPVWTDAWGEVARQSLALQQEY